MSRVHLVISFESNRVRIHPVLFVMQATALYTRYIKYSIFVNHCFIIRIDTVSGISSFLLLVLIVILIIGYPNLSTWR